MELHTPVHYGGSCELRVASCELQVVASYELLRTVRFSTLQSASVRFSTLQPLISLSTPSSCDPDPPFPILKSHTGDQQHSLPNQSPVPSPLLRSSSPPLFARQFAMAGPSGCGRRLFGLRSGASSTAIQALTGLSQSLQSLRFAEMRRLDGR